MYMEMECNEKQKKTLEKGFFELRITTTSTLTTVTS